MGINTTTSLNYCNIYRLFFLPRKYIMDQLVSLPQCMLMSVITIVITLLLVMYVLPCKCDCCPKTITTQPTTEAMLGYKTGTPSDSVLAKVARGY